jgi:hypothetical protein
MDQSVVEVRLGRGVRPQPRDRDLRSRRIEHLARCRSPQVGDAHLGGDPDTHLPDGRRREHVRLRAVRARRQVELALTHPHGPTQPRRAHAAERDAALGERRDAPEEVPRAVQAEVRAQHVAALDREEQLLADRARPHEHAPVEPCGPRREPSLRGRDGQPVPDEVAVELPRDAMDGMTFRHGRPA